jgi:hypothetical protein
MMVERKKTYIGTFPTEEAAACAYDQYSMLLNGIGSQPNFSYTAAQVRALIAEPLQF